MSSTALIEDHTATDARPRVPTRRPGLRWTPDLIAYAVDLWHRRHLHVPTADEWERAGDDHPSTKTVVRVFGSWNEAVRHAGLVPRKPGANLRWQAQCPARRRQQQASAR